MKKHLLIFGVLMLFIVGPASAALIDFEAQGPGPSLFGDPAQVVNVTAEGVDVTFTGGLIMTAVTNLPVDQTTVYGTAFLPPGVYQPILGVNFSSPVSDVSFFLMNGLTSDVTYTARDGLGDLVTVTLAPNFLQGAQTITFNGNIGNFLIVYDGFTAWDYFIDDVRFTNLNYAAVPEPGTLTLLGSGLIGLWFVGRKIVKN